MKFNVVHIHRESREEEQGKTGNDLYPLAPLKLGGTDLA